MSQAPLMLSISGCRGLIGQSLTPALAADYAGAVATWVRQARCTNRPHVLLGRDSRPSGAMLEAAVVAGLTAAGCRVTRLGIVTTPGVGVMVDHLHADAAIVITASHNPIAWNGLKVIRHDGIAPPPDEAAAIIDAFQHRRIAWASVGELGEVADDARTDALHVERVLAQVDVQAIRAAKLTVALESIHGAGGPSARKLLDALHVTVIHEHAEPTGHFPFTPEPTAENLAPFCRKVATLKVDAGFAQDPDADRLALIDENGQYLGEEYTLALTALHRLEAGAVTATNLSTSRMLDDIAARVGATVIRTPVGEAHVARAMRDHEALIGGEGNGGIILTPVSLIRDSLAGIALILDLLAQRRQTLSTLAASLPRYAMIKDKLPADPALTARLAEKLKGAFVDARFDDRDGVRLDWPDSWVHVRASNTEPILRLIAEAPDHAAARQRITAVRRALGLVEPGAS